MRNHFRAKQRITTHQVFPKEARRIPRAIADGPVGVRFDSNLAMRHMGSVYLPTHKLRNRETNDGRWPTVGMRENTGDGVGRGSGIPKRALGSRSPQAASWTLRKLKMVIRRENNRVPPREYLQDLIQTLLIYAKLDNVADVSVHRGAGNAEAFCQWY